MDQASEINRIDNELESEEYKVEYERHLDILNSFLRVLVFIKMDCNRSESLKEKFFCLSVVEDLLQSLVAIRCLAKEGIRNTCRRELRYIIELSIKACLISQKGSSQTAEEQISQFRSIIGSTNISMIKEIDFFYFDDTDKALFISEVGRAYGKFCLYVHSTPNQMRERFELDAKGRNIGFEGIDELRELNDEISKALYISLVLFFHAIPQWCVGDYLVEPDGHTIDSYFTKYRLISIIDQYFDYKHERQTIQSELQANRETRICY